MYAFSNPMRPFWARFAALLGFLAVCSALLAPASMLAQDMRTGKLGGVCSMGSSGLSLDAGMDDSSPATGHCDLCGSMGLGLPPLPQKVAAPATVTAMAVVFDDAVRSASSPGLPFSRGPPLL
ncbi:MAG: hypothetical protein Q7T70_10745 [Polaromonas sp.]|nr:hypothetical protein [Polaromonas sp.]